MFSSISRTSIIVSGAGICALTACSLADPSLYERLGGSDGGVDVGADGTVVDVGTDAFVEQEAVDQCAGDGIRVLSGTTEDIRIDTRTLNNTIGSLPSCGVSTPSPDGFIAVDVQEAEYWHFHLRVDTANDPDPTARNPVLYLLNSSCAPTMCSRELLSNFCDAQQDEHFAFTFTNAGMWYLGVDDTNGDGGVYLLDAIKPVCGDDEPEHGEACDGQDGCHEDCMWLIDEDNVRERGFNFNQDEANLVQLPPSNELTAFGDIGGFEGCTYPDVFAIDVGAGQTLEVLSRTSTGDACVGAGSPEFTLTLRSAGGSTLQEGPVTDGCANLGRTFTDAGRFFVIVQDNRPDSERDRPLSYGLLFRITS